MRAFEPFNKKLKFHHPEDMKQIIEYLEGTGKINIDYKFLEDIYYDYSESVCCGWRCVDDESLQQFAEYLARVEMVQGGYRLVGDHYEYYLEDDEDD
jgi:hypothetical protein